MTEELHKSVRSWSSVFHIWFDWLNVKIPDVKTGDDRVDAIVVDEESVGAVNARGCGGKVLRGDGALQRYLAQAHLVDQKVWSELSLV